MTLLVFHNKGYKKRDVVKIIAKNEEMSVQQKQKYLYLKYCNCNASQGKFLFFSGLLIVKESYVCETRNRCVYDYLKRVNSFFLFQGCTFG